MKMKIKLDEGAFLPERGHSDDAGLDLRAREAKLIKAGGFGIFDTGVHVEIPKGYSGRLASKSGLNVYHDLVGEGLIDTGYTGSLCVKLYNLGKSDYQIKRGDKIIQLVIEKILQPEIEVVDELGESERGGNGFGSTGK